MKFLVLFCIILVFLRGASLNPFSVHLRFRVHRYVAAPLTAMPSKVLASGTSFTGMSGAAMFKQNKKETMQTVKMGEKL
jgi:hypothetical protein